MDKNETVDSGTMLHLRENEMCKWGVLDGEGQWTVWSVSERDAKKVFELEFDALLCYEAEPNSEVYCEVQRKGSICFPLERVLQ